MGTKIHVVGHSNPVVSKELEKVSKAWVSALELKLNSSCGSIQDSRSNRIPKAFRISAINSRTWSRPWSIVSQTKLPGTCSRAHSNVTGMHLGNFITFKESIEKNLLKRKRQFKEIFMVHILMDCGLQTSDFKMISANCQRITAMNSSKSDHCYDLILITLNFWTISNVWSAHLEHKDFEEILTLSILVCFSAATANKDRQKFK